MLRSSAGAIHRRLGLMTARERSQRSRAAARHSACRPVHAVRTRRSRARATRTARARSPRSPVSMPNVSPSTSSTSAAVSSRVFSVPPARCTARWRPRRFQRASSVTIAAVNPTTKPDFGYVETYQLPTSRSICGRGSGFSRYSGCQAPRIWACSSKPSGWSSNR